MDIFLQGVAGIGGLLLLCILGWKYLLRPLLWRPHITQTIDYQERPEHRKRVDAYLARVSIQQEEAPRPARILPKIMQARLPERVVREPEQEMMPEIASFALPSSQNGPKIKRLEEEDPASYIDEILKAITKLYLASNQRTLSRTKTVPNYIPDSLWDYVIGPEVPGKQQPGLFRQIGMVEDNHLPHLMDTTINSFLNDYLERCGETNNQVVLEVEKIRPKLVKSWRNNTLEEEGV